MKPIKKVVIHEAVVTEIIKYIKENNLEEGDKLPAERELAKLLDVSRTSVREALKILEANYVINIKHGSGIYVHSLNSMVLSQYDTNSESKEILMMLKQLAETRIMIETFCSTEISNRITKEQLNQLYENEKNENKILSNKEQTPSDKVFVSMSLELMITEFYGNPFLTDFHKKVSELWKRYFNTINSVPYPSELRHNDHMDIIKAIESNNRGKIEKNIRNHVKRTIEALEKLLSSNHVDKDLN